MVVAFPPGGPVDIVARLIAPKITEALGQQVVIENVGGGGGNIAAQRVAKSRARRLHRARALLGLRGQSRRCSATPATTPRRT